MLFCQVQIQVEGGGGAQAPPPAPLVGHPDNLCLAIQPKQGLSKTATRNVHTEEL